MKFYAKREIDIIIIQETHIENESLLHSRGKIPGYLRHSIENAFLLYTSTYNNIFELFVKVEA